MKKELELWQFVAEKLKQKQTVMLLVVAESAGSSPGRQGFKMAITVDEMCGSIGGGVMEVRLVELARFKIKNEEFKIDSEIVEQNHKKNSANSSGMICSGRQTVIFFRLNPQHLKTIHKIIEALENYYFTFLQVTANEIKTVGLAGRRLYDDKTRGASDNNFDFAFEQSGENEFVYEELLGFKNNLFIIGGGHCALALSELASKMDFYISLFDDRADLNTLDKNRFADEKTVIASYKNIHEFVEGGINAYVVVMTLGYKSDETVIRQLLDEDFKYFGVLGSRAKMKTLLKNLEKEGFAKERLEKIRTPVGLPIGSRTPVEIAVSIAAEIIKVKNAK